MRKFSLAQSIYLDLLRFIAVQTVLFGHGLAFFHIVPIGSHDYIQESAVLWFLILSGLLITYNLMHSGKNYKFREYFIARFSRIYCGLVPCLFFILVVDELYIHQFGRVNYLFSAFFNIKTFLANIFMLQNFPHTALQAFGSGRPLWSLAIEWWMYMAFGLFYLKFWRKFSLRLLPFLLLVCIVPFYNTYRSFSNTGYDTFTLYWLLGCCLALFLFKMNCRANIKTSIFLLLVCVLCAFARLKLVGKAYDLPYVVMTAGVIYFLMDICGRVTENWQWLNQTKKYSHFFSSYSYTLYLIHYSIFTYLAALNGNQQSYVYLFLAMIFSNFLAYCIAFCTECRYKSIRRILGKYLLQVER